MALHFPSLRKIQRSLEICKTNKEIEVTVTQRHPDFIFRNPIKCQTKYSRFEAEIYFPAFYLAKEKFFKIKITIDPNHHLSKTRYLNNKGRGRTLSQKRKRLSFYVGYI